MLYNVKIQGRDVKIELPAVLPDLHPFTAKVSGKPLECLWQRSLGVLTINDQGVERSLKLRSYSQFQPDGEAEAQVTCEFVGLARSGVQCVEAVVAHEVPGQAARGFAHKNKGVTVRSQITGKTLKVLVKPGDEVQAGSTLVIIEAMKMENRIFANAPGKVASVAVSEGEQVSSGKELLKLTPLT